MAAGIAIAVTITIGGAIVRTVVAAIGDHGVASGATVLLLSAPVVDHVVGGQLEGHDRVDQTADRGAHRIALTRAKDERREGEQCEDDASGRRSARSVADLPRHEQRSLEEEGRENEEVECEQQLEEGDDVG